RGHFINSPGNQVPVRNYHEYIGIIFFYRIMKIGVFKTGGLEHRSVQTQRLRLGGARPDLPVPSGYLVHRAHDETDLMRARKPGKTGSRKPGCAEKAYPHSRLLSFLICFNSGRSSLRSKSARRSIKRTPLRWSTSCW